MLLPDKEVEVPASALGAMYNRGKAEALEEVESILAEVIDHLYLQYKPNFCDWDNKTHLLGQFKETVKLNFHVQITKQGEK